MKFQVLMLRGVTTILGSVVLSVSLTAQEDKRVVVAPFNYQNVVGNVEEVFGSEYDLGNGIAELVRSRLEEEGLTVVENEGDGSVEGSVLVFGKEEGRGEAGGISVGGVRVGLGKKKEVAVVMLQAQLIDGATGRIVTMASGGGESSRGGTEIFARMGDDVDLGTIDLSSDEFKDTSIGEATHKAVEQLCEEIVSAAEELGTFEPVAQADPVDQPPTMETAGGGGPVGSFMWAPYQFNGTEHFRYEVRQGSETGFYQLDLEPAGNNRVRIKVMGQLGDQTYASTVTTGTGQQGMQMGMGQFMTMGPIGIVLFNPMAWMMVSGRELTMGDGWSYSGGGESVSVKVERECRRVGHGGLVIVTRDNGEMVQESCVASDVPLPLRILMQGDDDGIEMTLIEYRP